jgi:hypothetical protein
MKQILTLLIVFLLTSCSIDSSITVTIENNSDKEITGNFYVVKDSILDNISISPKTKKEFIIENDTIYGSMKKQDYSEGNLVFTTNDNTKYIVCGYIDVIDVCAKKSFYMTIKEDMSYDVEHK